MKKFFTLLMLIACLGMFTISGVGCAPGGGGDEVVPPPVEEPAEGAEDPGAAGDPDPDTDTPE